MRGHHLTSVVKEWIRRFNDKVLQRAADNAVTVRMLGVLISNNEHENSRRKQ